jgi:hypothetical protein
MFKLFGWIRQGLARAVAGGILDGVQQAARTLSCGEVVMENDAEITCEAPTVASLPPAVQAPSGNSRKPSRTGQRG